MANTDVTVTLAGQFAALDPKQCKLVEIAGKGLQVISIATKPTVAQWNTLISTAVGLFPPAVHRDMRPQRAACYWQEAIVTVGSGLAVSGKSNSQILDISSPIQGLDDVTLDALSLYLEGRILFNSVYS